MALLQTTQRVNVTQHRAQQIQVYTVTNQTTNVILFHYALKPTAHLPIAQLASVGLPIVLTTLDCSATSPHQHVLATAKKKIAVVTLKQLKTHRTV